MTPDGQEYARHDLGACSIIVAESTGRPGQRFFRLRANAERGSLLLWLEKEQLSELATAIKQTLRTQVRPFGEPPSQAEERPSVDFDCKVTSLALGHDHESDTYLIISEVIRDDAEDSVAVWLSKEQLDRLADQALEVCAAGRPRCPLCGAAINEGEEHTCPRSNGHSK